MSRSQEEHSTSAVDRSVMIAAVKDERAKILTKMEKIGKNDREYMMEKFVKLEVDF